MHSRDKRELLGQCRECSDGLFSLAKIKERIRPANFRRNKERVVFWNICVSRHRHLKLPRTLEHFRSQDRGIGVISRRTRAARA